MWKTESFAAWGGEKGGEKYDYAAKALRRGDRWRVDIYEGTQPFDRCIGTIYGVKDVESMADIMSLDEVKERYDIHTGSLHLEDRRYVSALLSYLDEAGEEEDTVVLQTIPRFFGGPGFYFSHEGMYQALGLAMDILSEDYPDARITMQPGYILRCETESETFLARVTTADREEAAEAGEKL